MNAETPLTQIPPAQLWIGNQDELAIQTERYLQHFFCPHKGCGNCTTCMQIRQQQHHGCIWINPERGYTVESLTVIFETLSFSLQPDQHIFFILHKTDYLSITCANSLLKSLEEPTTGYHFILLASRQDALLPTIKSRCIIKTFNTQSLSSHHENLYAILTTHPTYDPATFLKAVDTSKINEHESIELLDTLLAYWIKIYAQSIEKENRQDYRRASERINILKASLAQPPMPGSSKLFWRNIFMAFSSIEKQS